VRFIFIGACLNDITRDAAIRARAEAMSNVSIPGWVDANERGAILDSAWILINTSTRECLPVSYLEAGARGCAILSHCDADDFASHFGYWARRGDLEDYVEGLSFLLGNDRWKSFGEKAREYVKSTHEYEKVIDQHVSVYREALARKSDRLAS
jgi:glycosyltransferase involved in cell wall biosynthesis